MSNAAAEHFVKLIAVTFFDRGRFSQSGSGGWWSERAGDAPPDRSQRICLRSDCGVEPRRLCREKALAPAATACIGLRRRRSDWA